MYSKNLRALPRSPIYQQSIVGFRGELERFFGPKNKVNVLQIKHEGGFLKDIIKNNPNQKFPVFVFRALSLATDTTKQSNTNLRRQGLMTRRIQKPVEGRDLEAHQRYEKSFIQRCLLTVEVYYVGTYDNVVLEFAPLWLEYALGNTLNFRIQIGDQSPLIQVELNPEIEFPQLTEEGGHHVVASTQAVLHTFHGGVEETKPIRTHRVQGRVVERESNVPWDEQDNYSGDPSEPRPTPEQYPAFEYRVERGEITRSEDFQDDETDP